MTMLERGSGRKEIKVGAGRSFVASTRAEVDIPPSNSSSSDLEVLRGGITRLLEIEGKVMRVADSQGSGVSLLVFGGVDVSRDSVSLSDTSTGELDSDDVLVGGKLDDEV